MDSVPKVTSAWRLLLALPLLIASGTSQAGTALAVPPDYPTPVDVGLTYDVTVSFTNGSDGAQAVGPVVVAAFDGGPHVIRHNPSCPFGASSAPCPTPDFGVGGSGVFDPSETGTGVAGSACAGINFQIVGPDAAGEFFFRPPVGTEIFMEVGETCSIAFTVDVIDVPSVDSSVAPGLQTTQTAYATTTHVGTSDNGSGTGEDTTTVNDCAVEIDKQICCGTEAFCADDANWVDAGLEGSDGDSLIEGCLGLDGSDVRVRYQAKNIGGSDVTACEIVDTVDGTDTSTDWILLPPLDVGDLGSGQFWPGLEGDYQLASGNPILCSNDLESKEPNRATLTCACGVDAQGNPGEATAFDRADVECVNPMYSISKICDDTLAGVANDGRSKVEITFEALGSESDIRCDIEDRLYYEDMDCSDGVEGAFAVLYSQADVVIGADQSSLIFEDEVLLFANACNKVVAEQCEACVRKENGECLEWVPLPSPMDMDMDSALCPGQPPAVEVAKVCEDAGLGELEDGLALVTVDVSRAAGDVVDTTVTCAVSDDIYLDDPDCSDGAAGSDVVNLIDATTDPLGVGESDTFNANVGDGTAGIGPLETAACNKATISSCEATPDFGGPVDVTPDMPANMSTDECPPKAGEGCLTRTPGYWKNHADIGEYFIEGKGIQVCGEDLESPWDIMQGMCVSGAEADRAGDYTMTDLQIIRQCTAAAINIEATNTLEGDCDSEYPGTTAMFNACCTTADSCTDGTYSVMECIGMLDEFNNSGEYDLNNELDQTSLCPNEDIGTPLVLDSCKAYTTKQCQCAGEDGLLLGSEEVPGGLLGCRKNSFRQSSGR